MLNMCSDVAPKLGLKNERKTALSGHREYVAVIDDELDLVELFTDALLSAGFKVRGFVDPLLALKHLSKHHSEYMVLLSDMRMPGMSGFELSKIVHQMDEEIRIECMSAFELYDQKIEELPIRQFIRKPMHISDLVNFIEGVIPH